MSNNYQFLSLQRVPVFGGFEPAPSELSYVKEWIESQRDRLANFADEVVGAFAECHRAAATEMEVDYPFEYALQVCVRRSGINHIWHRAIFYGGRESPKRVDYHEISQNRFADIPDWERLVYERVINSLNSLYKHQAQLLKLIQRYRALQASLRQF